MTATDLAGMRRMRGTGAADAAIAARYGVSRQRVHKLLGARPVRQAKPRAAPPSGPSRMDFAAALLAWRTKRGLSQTGAARALRVTTHTVSCWETQRNGCALAASMLLLMELMP